MGYIGRKANGFNQASQSALAVTVNGIDQVLITTSSFNYSGSTLLTGDVLISGSGLVVSGTFGVTGDIIGLSTGSANVSASFNNSQIWTLNHNFGQRFVIVQAFDYDWKQIIPQNITLVNDNTVTLTFETEESGYAVASVGGGAFHYAYYSINNTASALFATTGSNTFTGNQTVIGSVSASQGFTGSLFGTSSWATNTVSSSYISSLNQNVNITGSVTITGSLTVVGSSTNIGTTISTSGSTTTITGSLLVTGSTGITGSLSVTQGITGSLFGTSSWADNVITASYVTGAIYDNTNPVLSASFAATASLAPNYVLNSSTSSFVQNTQTSSFVVNDQTSSFVQNTQTSSFVQNTQTSSFVQNTQTSSFVRNTQTSSFVQNTQTSSFVQNTQTSSFLTTSSFNSYTSSATSQFAGTSSFAQTASIALISGPSDFALTAYSASFANNITNGFVKTINTSDTRIILSSTTSTTGSAYSISLTNTGSSFSQNGQILALAIGMANTF
jgi:hypothetical protein